MRIELVTLLLAAAPLTGLACSDEEVTGGSRDREPPTILLLAPANESEIPPTPTFRLRLTDEDSGILPETIMASIRGRDLTEEFGDAYDPATGELSVPIRIPLEEGLNTLEFQVSDQARNQATARFSFSVVNESVPPPDT